MDNRFMPGMFMFCSRYDALIYARALSPRTPGTHNLHIVEDADHNFTAVCFVLDCIQSLSIECRLLTSQRQDEVVNTVLEWCQALKSGQLKSGIWKTGTRGKL
jgi:hypothetical protein